MQLEITNIIPGTSSSKIGGNVELEKGEDYPTINGKNCKFLIQINFSVLDEKADLLPKTGLLQILHGSISQAEIFTIYRPEGKFLTNTPIPDKLNFNGDNGYQYIEEKELIQTTNLNSNHIELLSSEIIDQTSIYLEMTDNQELQTNVLQINDKEIEYFGQIMGEATVDELLQSKENCFQTGLLTWEEWKDKLSKFDKNKNNHIRKFNDLV